MKKANILFFLSGLVVGLATGLLVGSAVIAALPSLAAIYRTTEGDSVYPWLGLLYISRDDDLESYHMRFESRFSFGDTVIVKDGDASGTTGTVRGIVLNAATSSLLYQVEISPGKLMDVSLHHLDTVMGIE